MKGRKYTCSLVCALALSLATAPIVSSVTHQTTGGQPAKQLVQAATDVNDYIADQGFTNPDITTYASTFTKGFAYRQGVGQPEGIVIHETANPNSTIDNEIAYMQREWPNMYSYVHAFVDHSRIINIHSTDYGVWGAGPAANARFIQIELVRAHSLDEFARSVNNDAYYTAYLLKQYNLPVTLADNTGAGTVWSHNAVSNYLGGTDHTDPVGYFAQWGYDMNQFFALVQRKYNELSGNEGNGQELDQVVSARAENLYGKVNGNNTNGTYVLTSKGFRFEKMSAAYDGQVFRIDQSAQTNKGVTMYEMADENGKGLFWVIATQVDVLGDWHTTPSATVKAAAGVYTVTQSGRGTGVLAAPGGLNRQGRFLATGTRWLVHAVGVTATGQTYYQVGTDQWVSAGEGTFVPTANPTPTPETPVYSTLSGVVKVTQGSGASVYGSPAQSPSGRTLAAGSAWQVFQKATFKDGSVWYRVSGKEWIAGRDSQLQTTPPTGVVPEQPVTYHSAANGIATVTATSGATLKRAPNGGADAGSLPQGSRWVVNKVAVLANGQGWYLVGTNQWLSGQQAILNANGIMPLTGVVKVTKGSTASLTNDHGQVTPGTLPTGSRWQVTGMRTANGAVYYRVATNGWVAAADSRFE